METYFLTIVLIRHQLLHMCHILHMRLHILHMRRKMTMTDDDDDEDEGREAVEGGVVWRWGVVDFN